MKSRLVHCIGGLNSPPDQEANTTQNQYRRNGDYFWAICPLEFHDSTIQV